jgi:hypothetical protein
MGSLAIGVYMNQFKETKRKEKEKKKKNTINHQKRKVQIKSTIQQLCEM